MVTLVFVAFYVLPGDRVDQVIGGERVIAPEVRAATAERLGLNDPLARQYGDYWKSLLSGDLGQSAVNQRAVATIVAETVPSSLRLAFWAFVFEILIAAVVATVVAVRRKPWLDRTMTAGSTLLLAFPVLVVATGLQLVLAVVLARNGLPALAVQGIGPDKWWLGIVPSPEQWRHTLLPALSMALVASAVVMRVAKRSIRDVLDAPYIAGARSRGLSFRRILVTHVLRMAAAPIVTILAIDLVALFGSAVVTEKVFNWPGVGSELADALTRADAPVVLGFTVLIAVAYVVVTTVADVLSALLDPSRAAR